MKYIWDKQQWPNFKWQSNKLISDLSKARFLQGDLLGKICSLGFEQSEESRSEILTKETIKTAAIEGVRLDEEAVRSSVARRLGLPKGGYTAPDRNIEGLIDVIMDATTNYKKPLTTKRLKSWQAALFPTGYSGLNKIITGNWRGKMPMQVVSGPMGREKIHFEAPPWNRVEKEMKMFIDWWEKKSKGIDGILRAGIAHLYFVTVHPFEDGNGRIARAITDKALAQDENLARRDYSLSARIMVERKGYYHILGKSQKGTMDITEWLVWFLKCYCGAINDSKKLVSGVLLKAAFWQDHAQTILNKNQRKVINRLLEAGQGGFAGGLSTRKYVGITRVSRATAYRDINDLMEKKVLAKSKGKGRSVTYELIFPKIP